MVGVFLCVCSHRITANHAVCRTHHFLQPLPQMEGQGVEASQGSLSRSPLFSVRVMDFLVYLVFMHCLLSQCTGRTRTRTHTRTQHDTLVKNVWAFYYTVMRLFSVALEGLISSRTNKYNKQNRLICNIKFKKISGKKIIYQFITSGTFWELKSENLNTALWVISYWKWVL